MSNLQEQYLEWLSGKREPFVAKRAERRKSFETSSGCEYPPLAIPAEGSLSNDAQESYQKSLGFPGQFPYTRGVYPNMYRGRFWTMRQYAGFASAEDSNKRYHFLLDSGVSGLSVAFDLPTQIGYDSDDPMAEGEIGKVGVPVCSTADMDVLFDGIPLDKVSTSMTINSSAVCLLAFYLLQADKQGVSWERLRGTLQNDLLKEFVARGTYIYPPRESLRLTTDIIEFCANEVPNFNAISISGYHIREAGSTAAQEIAFTISNGLEYVKQATSRGLDVNKFGGNLSFFFNGHNNLLEEVAKYRAARRIWARLMKTRFSASNEKALMLRFHTQTAGSTLTAQQPENNIVRTTIQALGAVLGGTQSLHTNSFDEALALPTEKSTEIALRTQQVIAFESGVADTPDPLAGSYIVEQLTDELEEKAMSLIAEIDDLGGAAGAIEQSFMSSEVARAALQFQRRVERNEDIVVGVNKFVRDETSVPELQKIDKAAADKQLERLGEFKSSRDGQKTADALKRLKETASSNTNLVPTIIDAVSNGATLGEVCNTLRDVFGEYRGE
ncbi:MAG: acyl-CoA mutase large subunit family protein [Planctomycetota bacterium]|jgi:methylmalonyl-CoA mutase N-terminal domain/subunit